jgi:hypothetical protein
VPGVGTFFMPALEEDTEYAVLITNRVKDAAGNPIRPTTLGKILLFTNPVSVGGKSQLLGVSDAQAAGLEAMRQRLVPGVVAQLASDHPPLTKADVAMAYTFRTQTISGTSATTSHGGTASSAPGAIQISGIPYTPLLTGVCGALAAAAGIANLDCTKPLPSPFAFNTYTSAGAAGSNIADAFAKYGVDLSVPHGNIDTIYEFQIATVNKLDNATGAFDPNPAGARPEALTVLLAVGAQPAMPDCTGPLAPFAAAGLRCAPLVVFQHGITTSKSYVLSVADELVADGNVVAGVDLVWHGDRTYCNTAHDSTNPNVECAGGSVCVPDPALAGQAVTGSPAPGKCRAGPLFTDPAAPFVNQAAVCPNPGTVGVPGSSCALVTGVPFPITLDPGTGLPTNQGYPAASGEFLVSANFFRTRDSLRQSLIDHAQVLQVVAPTPQAGPIAGNDLYNALLAKGILVSPFGSSIVGQSLGSMVGALSAAANPRLSKAVFNTGGGTLVDVFTTAPRSKPDVDALFFLLGIDTSKIATDPAVAAKYLQLINVLKWVLDPADPVNATGHLGGATWPNLLPPLGGNTDGSVAQAAKPVLAQAALCDQRVPNPFNALFAATAGLSPTLPPAAPPGPTGTVQWFVNTSGPSFPASQDYPLGCALGVAHDFFANWGTGIADATQFSKEQELTAAAHASAAAFLASPVPLTPTLVVR